MDSVALLLCTIPCMRMLLTLHPNPVFDLPVDR
ncbi:Protein of unknown function [Pyronema omphalodes CBS 100304]|uniref:Uncharacterized protein n=1 Tax=Pyronema omphalodes (strain CBS 100304) TaxID=1076935 RepID=U4LQJ4_PYROM|nr:Protein of unknown function [Pyronema omphalodes CBS 100304]